MIKRNLIITSSYYALFFPVNAQVNKQEKDAEERGYPV